MVSFSARRIPRSHQRDAWDALADIEVFIFATEAELAAMEAERVGVHRRGRKPDAELRRRVLGLILKHPLIFRRRILLGGVVVLLNRGNHVEQDDRRTKAWVHAISGCQEFSRQCSF
jgi:hypothetical protein